MSFARIVPNNLIHAADVNQIIDALDGASGAGIPISITAVNDQTNFALTIQNDDTTNQRALNVLNPAGTSMIRVDSGGVTLGAPLTLPPASVSASELAPNALVGQAVGGDLTGTADNAHVVVKNASSIGSINASGTQRYFFQPTGDNYNAIFCSDSGLIFVNDTNTTRIGTLDNSGNLSLLGSIQADANLAAIGSVVAGASSSSGTVFLGNTNHSIQFDGTNYGLYGANAWIGGALHLDSNGANPNSGGAFLTFPQAVTAKISLYDNGGGSYWGFGMNSNELYTAIYSAGVFSIRQNAGSGAQVLTINGSNGTITFPAGGEIIAAGEGYGYADTVYLSAHAHVYYNLTVGNTVTASGGMVLAGSVPGAGGGQLAFGGFTSGGPKGGSSDSFQVQVNGVTRYVPLYI